MADPSRRNLLTLKKEHWKPPAYPPNAGFTQKLKLGLFRFLDLQMGTVWRDLSRELPRVKGTALDVGCGLQPFRPLFAPGVRYIGLDTVDSKAHFGYEAPDTLYYKGKTWPVKTRAVDFILCTETLEHVAEPMDLLKEASRVLKPGGHLLLTVPFAARWHFIPYDYWRYTPSSLKNLLTQAGFSDIQVFARGNQLTVACYKVMALIFAMLMPVSPNWFLGLFSRLLGILLLPLFGMAAILANLSLAVDGTVDCLGYTVLAERKEKVRSGKS